MNQLIDKIDIGKILLATHEYLLIKPSSSDSKSDDNGIRITKTIVNELVKLKKESIWDYYEGVKAHSTPDLYIKKWIEIILASLNGGAPMQRPSTAPVKQKEEYRGGLSEEDSETLKGLLSETQWGNQFRADQAFKSLLDFINDFPSLDFDAYLRAYLSSQEQTMILTGIMKAKKRIQLTGNNSKNLSSSFRAPLGGRLQTPNKLGLGASGKASRQSTAAKLQEYQNRLQNNNLKPKNGASLKTDGTDSAGSSLKQEVDNRLGNSIAAMNSSITEKWRMINSKGLANRSGLNNTVGSGFKRKALQDKSTLDKESNDNEQPEQDLGSPTNTKMALQARLNEVKVRYLMHN